MILLLASGALAAPDRLANTFEVGPEVTDIVVSPDGAWIGWNEATGGKFWVMDTGTFKTTVVNVCAGASGAAATADIALGVTFYTGCDDGTVASVEISPEGFITQGTEPLTMGTGAVVAVETDGDNVYAVLKVTDSNLQVAGVALETGGDVSGFPINLQYDTVEDSVLLGNVLILAHGQEDVSKIVVDGGILSTPQNPLGSDRSLVDAFPAESANTVYLADSSGGLIRFQNASNNYQNSVLDPPESVTAVGFLPAEGWMILGAGEDDALLYTFDSVPGTEQGPIPGAVNLEELVVIEGYAFGTTSDGTVLAITDRPWVDVSALTPAAGGHGQEVTFTFTSDVAGDYQVRLNGNASGSGVKLGAGGTVEADKPTTVTFTIDAASNYAEGENDIWVFVTDANNRVGRGAGTLTIDNPPVRVSLDESNVAWGNGAITVSFTALTAEDIKSYALYITTQPFSADDYPRGGPVFDGTDAIKPMPSLHGEPGTEVSKTISPLTNGTTYYVAIRATDQGGLEGPMSAIVSTTPQETFSASQRAGEQGGHFPGICGLQGGAGSAAILFAAAAIARRRRRFVGGAAVLVLSALALRAPAAQAAEEQDYESPRTMNVQLRFGPTTVVDPYIKDVFGGKPNYIMWFEYGYASRFIDANLGIGFYQHKGFLQTETGEVSGEDDKLTMVPLTLNLTARLDLFEEQPIVPFGRIGVDYWMFEENWYVANKETTDHITSGGKYGWHFGGGLMILLDVFDRRAASRLEAISSINDTYLVAEYRKTRLVTGANQFNLSSSEFTFGLKFDF